MELLAQARTVRAEFVEHADVQHAGIVLVDWMVGNSCNYACSYCPAGLHDGSFGWQPLEDILSLFDQLREHYAEGLGRHVWLQFTGGEPTMHPGALAFLQRASEYQFSTSLISNGSRTIRFWSKVRPWIRNVILTYHSEFVDHEHFVQVCSLLSETMPVQVNVTVPPTRFDQVLDRAADLTDRCPGLTVVLKPLRENFGGKLYPYTKEQVERLQAPAHVGDHDGVTPRGIMSVRFEDGTTTQRRANVFILQGTNRWKGYRCEAGLESLRIKADGSVLRAVCGAGGVIGKIGEELYFPLTSITCDRDSCSCVSDILITKRRRTG